MNLNDKFLEDSDISFSPKTIFTDILFCDEEFNNFTCSYQEGNELLRCRENKPEYIYKNKLYCKAHLPKGEDVINEKSRFYFKRCDHCFIENNAKNLKKIKKCKNYALYIEEVSNKNGMVLENNYYCDQHKTKNSKKIETIPNSVNEMFSDIIYWKYRISESLSSERHIIANLFQILETIILDENQLTINLLEEILNLKDTDYLIIKILQKNLPIESLNKFKSIGKIKFIIEDKSNKNNNIIFEQIDIDNKKNNLWELKFSTTIVKFIINNLKEEFKNQINNNNNNNNNNFEPIKFTRNLQLLLIILMNKNRNK